MTESTCIQEREGEYTIDFEKLVEIFAKSLYPKEDMFIRELLQNAHDSIIKRQISDPMHLGRIDIQGDRASRLLIFRDNGIGMTEDEVRDYLCTIGRSGTREVREKLMACDKEMATSLIGQFGIGMLSAFVAADKVVADTRSIENNRSQGLRWSPSGGKTYKIKTIDMEKPGTTVLVHLKQQYLRLTNPEVLKEAICKYGDFLEVPIFINGEGPINSINPPWDLMYSNEEVRKKAYRDWLYTRFPDTPIEIIPVNLEFPYPVKGILYISDRRVPDINRSGAVDVYQKRMFVCERNHSVLPVWASFICGVIDSPAYNLTAARDAVQEDTVHSEIREALGMLIIDALLKLAKEDTVRFQRLMKWHHYQIKGMAVEFDEFFDAIADSILFEVSVPDTSSTDQSYQMITLPEYVKKYPSSDETGKKIIHFIREEGAAPQFYRLCQANGLIAINASLMFDDLCIKKYVERHNDELTLKQVDIADSDAIFEPLSDNERKYFLGMEHTIQMLIQRNFPDQELVVRTERFEPAATPAVMTQTRDYEVSKKLEYLIGHPAIISDSYRELLSDVWELQKAKVSPVVLHLNAKNRLVSQLRSEDFDDSIIQDVLLTFYQNAFLYSQQHLTPHDIELQYEQTLRSLEHVVALREQIRSFSDRKKVEVDQKSRFTEPVIVKS
jgi:molecular chaperone HtpG